MLEKKIYIFTQSSFLDQRLTLPISHSFFLVYSGDGPFGGDGEFVLKFKPVGQLDACYLVTAGSSGSLSIAEQWKYRVRTTSLFMIFPLRIYISEFLYVYFIILYFYKM